MDIRDTEKFGFLFLAYENRKIVSLQTHFSIGWKSQLSHPYFVLMTKIYKVDHSCLLPGFRCLCTNHHSVDPFSCPPGLLFEVVASGISLLRIYSSASPLASGHPLFFLSSLNFYSMFSSPTVSISPHSIPS